MMWGVIITKNTYTPKEIIEKLIVNGSRIQYIN
jgi:hypothetical protein